MANPMAGEVELIVDGKPRLAKLTLGALAELEASIGAESLLDMVERFESRRFSSRDVLSVIVAGLRGGGWQVSAADLMQSEVEGGAFAASRIAAQLLVRAFSMPAST